MTKAKRAAALVGLTVSLSFPVGVAMATGAAAVTCTYPAVCEQSGEVGDAQANQASTPAAAPTATGAAAASRSTLPVTGGDIVGLTVIGAGAVAAGFVLSRRTRRS